LSLRLARSLACAVSCGALVALPAGTAQAATPSAKLRTISAPPKAALAPGAKLRVSGRLTNQTRKRAKARVTLTLRSTKRARAITLGAKTTARVKAGRTARYTLTVTLPASLADGTYYLRGCARVGSRASGCRYATRKLKVAKPKPNPQPNPSPNPVPAPNPGAGPKFDVLAFGADSAGVATLRDLAKEGGFKVTESSDPSLFTAERLEDFRAVVLFGDIGSPLSAAQEAAFEKYFKAGGGLLAVGSAIESEPDWSYLTELLGTRADGAPVAATGATIKVADRVHEASKTLPEYWTRSDRFYNFTDNVRGRSHVLATVDETTYQGGKMTDLADHPVAWCKDYQGGRSFYTNVGANGDFSGADAREHLAGAIQWTAGEADPVYSDCGATVLANYQQVKISDNTIPGSPGLREPIGFDVLPDGRVLQTARGGELRLHDPKDGSVKVIADLPVYTNSEDGLYGPAVDNDFATNKWVYLYYAPRTVTNVKQSDGTTRTITTPPNDSAPTVAPSLSAWDPFVGYFQLSRFKLVEDGNGPRLDIGSEQKIMRVSNNRGACCHVAGDIDFDSHNNLWLVTGDDTPSGGGNSGGFSPHNDMKTDETQTVAVTATSGTFTLGFDGQTTAAIAYNATPAAIRSALEALPNINPGDVIVTGAAGNATVQFDGAYAQKNVPELTSTGATIATTQQGNWFQAPFVDARRTSGNTNDLRGKVLRIKVNADGSYTTPAGNLFPESQDADDRTRPEIYAMGFRNPFRIQVDDNDVAYVTDYSPDSATPENFRGPAGTGRVEVIRKASNYGWPLCYGPELPYYRWNFNTSKPLDPTPEAYECDNPERGPQNRSRWNTGADLDPATEPGRVNVPPITQPDLWYSFRDNANPPLGTPCLAYYDGSGGSCPQRFPELYTTGVAPHGAAPYRYDPANTSTTKFPPYYDGAFIVDTLREVRVDSQDRIFKINRFLDCGAALSSSSQFAFECDNPMDMQFGTDGSFYLLTYGDGFFQSNPDAGMYRWEYVKGQRKPQAVLKATPTNGVAPLTVQFSSVGSRDPDPGDSIRFEWDFDGDGTVDSTDPNPSHVYTVNDDYDARLTVTDSTGKAESKTVKIIVGNTAPTISITTPLDGDFFEWGDRIPFTVTASDPEDGPIDCSRVVVTFVLVHDTHGHAEEAKTGCSGTLQTLAEDASHGGYIAGGISATYTDNGANGQPALSATAQHVVQVRRQQVEYAQEHEGTSTTAATEADPGGGQVRSSLDPGDWIALNRSVNLTNMDKRITLRFAGPGSFPPFIPVTPVGTELADVEVRDGSPTGPVLATVRLKSTGDLNTYQDFSAPLDYAGSKRLYLVFKQFDGGPVIPFIGYGYLNSVSFSGAGAGVRP
jgi:PKD repeat protein/type 1 glutamine amidotransferase